MDGMEKYPKFKSLMEMLKSRMTVDGISLQLAADLKEAQERLQETKKTMFQNELVFSELQEIMLELSDKKMKQTLSPDELQAYEMLQEALRNADAKNYLKISSTEDDASRGNIFGLTEERLGYKESKRRNIQQILQQYFVPDIEQRLKERCVKLMKLWDSKIEGESDGLTLAKAAKLPLLVENESKKISDGKNKLKTEKRNYTKLLLDFKKVMKEYMERLEEFMEKYPLDSQAEMTKATVEWLEAKCEAVQLKIKVLQYQLLKDTYDEESIAALKKIRDQLEAALAESKTELAKCQQTVTIYQSVGSGFDSLVKEHARLTAEIDNRKWALAELKRSQQNE